MAKTYAYSKKSHHLFTPTQHSQAPHHERKAEEFFEDWTAADKSNQDMLCAELSRLVYGSEGLVKAALPRADLRMVDDGWLDGKGLVGEAKSWGTECFVAEGAAGATYLVFRGTETKPLDIVTDLRALQDAWQAGVKVHAGFKDAYEAVRDKLHALIDARPGPLVITGHSLGAALATLAASDFKNRAPKLVTFGSPRVGDAAFASLFAGQQVTRYVDCADIVPRVPLVSVTKENVADVLGAFVGDGFLAGGLETAVTGFLKTAVSGLKYEHVGELRYIGRNGGFFTNPKQSFMAADQQQARDEYGSIFAPIALAGRDFDGLKDGLQSLFQSNGGEVGFRDLADHAMLNYLSAFTGRS